MAKILVLGTGRIGAAIAHLLCSRLQHQVSTADIYDSPPELLPDYKKVRIEKDNPDALVQSLVGYDAVVAALPYYLSTTVAKAALAAGASYFDLTEDVKSTKEIQKIALSAKEGQVFMPQCGLAPGATAIIANGLFKEFNEAWNIMIRVGALPKSSSTRLGYALTWSPDGLINEYLMPCEAIINGDICTTIPLDGLERLVIGGSEYEAFNTSGGLGTLCHTLRSRVYRCDYKTIRYRGHCEAMRLLLWELRLQDHGDVLKRAMEATIPSTNDDVVVFHCAANGMIKGKIVEKTYSTKIFGTKTLSAIQNATASAACAVVNLMVGREPFETSSPIATQGFVRQEDVPMDRFLSDSYAEVYRKDVEER